MAGQVGQHIDHLLHSQVAEKSEDLSHQRKRKDYNADITFVEEYKEDQLFKYIPKRQHQSFPAFISMVRVKNPEKLKPRLMKYNKKLDRSRDVYI